jgi:hypothetical protein
MRNEYFWQDETQGGVIMSLSLILACIWAVAANLAAMIPARDHHWRRAYLLIGCGISLLGFVTYENGPIAGLIVLAAGMSLLRWPVVHLTRRLRRRIEE